MLFFFCFFFFFFFCQVRDTDRTTHFVDQQIICHLTNFINKSQGQTLDFVGLDLTNEVFTQGQLYVAFSRVRSFSSISILPDPHSSVNENCFTDNVVYK